MDATKMQGNILVLGGTHDGVRIATMLHYHNMQVMYSIKGLTVNPHLPPCTVKQGGYGSDEHFIQYCRQHQVTHIIDATHPFATRMSARAYKAAHILRINYCYYHRPEVTLNIPLYKADSLAGISQHISNIVQQDHYNSTNPYHIFIALGAHGTKELLDIMAWPPYVLCTARMLQPWQGTSKLNVIYGKPPSHQDEEILWREQGYHMLVLRDSGHNMSAPKIELAHILGMDVVMLTRPQNKQGQAIYDDDHLMAYLRLIL